MSSRESHRYFLTITVRLAFLEAFELARDTEFFAGFTYEPDSSVAEVPLHPVAFLST
jgi:hypothetical protein